jgi:hypothetical protein
MDIEQLISLWPPPARTLYHLAFDCSVEVRTGIPEVKSVVRGTPFFHPSFTALAIEFGIGGDARLGVPATLNVTTPPDA